MTTENLVTANENVDLNKAENILQNHKIEKLPVIDNNNLLVGLITFRDITKHLAKPNANKDEFGRLRVAAAVGITHDLLERTTALVKSNVDAIVIDPPRAGALSQVTEISKTNVGRIAFVSCNPTTFARDAAILCNNGYNLDWVQVVDQFLWNPHIELVAQFTK